MCSDHECPPGKRREMDSKTADTPINELGDDLLREILIRLPNPRFTSRCKPVCKQWNSLISNPSFRGRFISHHQRKNESGGEPSVLILPAAGGGI
ncbi:unnamed protein product [Linum tenue]|uniref:F-box domain-containing protein n=1 Tax=Linum tenue TaxID=586396 RepID=A0AAV0IV11_9ROSI|nr:unnamed protein product [Linum tenue]